MKGFTFWIALSFLGCVIGALKWTFGTHMEWVDWLFIGYTTGALCSSFCLFMENVGQ